MSNIVAEKYEMNKFQIIKISKLQVPFKCGSRGSKNHSGPVLVVIDSKSL